MFSSFAILVRSQHVLLLLLLLLGFFCTPLSSSCERLAFPAPRLHTRTENKCPAADTDRHVFRLSLRVFNKTHSDSSRWLQCEGFLDAFLRMTLMHPASMAVRMLIIECKVLLLLTCSLDL